MHILQDDSLLRRVRLQINPAFQSAAAGDQPDIKVLLDDPLLNSVFHETLRLRVASTVGRTSLDDGLCLAGGWKVKAGVPIMFTGWLSGLDESAWNTGPCLPDGQSQYPLGSFWADRFLECPGNPVINGPAKKRRIQPVRDSPEKSTSRTEWEDGQPKASLVGLRGHFFPFGGGAYRCPGEAMAKQVVLTSVAIVLQNWSLKLVNPEEARKTEPSHRELPFGLHSFDRPVPVDISKL